MRQEMFAKNYLRAATKRSKGIRGIIVQTSRTVVGLTKLDIGNPLEDMNTYILHLIAFQFYTLQVKKKK
jgi:hypothetical protein